MRMTGWTIIRYLKPSNGERRGDVRSVASASAFAEIEKGSQRRGGGPRFASLRADRPPRRFIYDSTLGRRVLVEHVPSRFVVDDEGHAGPLVSTKRSRSTVTVNLLKHLTRGPVLP